MILKGHSDDDIRKHVDEYKISMEASPAEELSANIGINNMSKYIKNDCAIKGTPYHVKGACNYHMLLKEFNIQNKYERIKEGDKAKVVYLKRNRFGITVVSYYDWPKEFTENGLQLDYGKQIEKFFVGKVKFLLEPQNREKILTQSKCFDIFF
jgi:hypothetical protein